jgi:D-alanine-D-alanine ligase
VEALGMTSPLNILVLGGGPDAEREVSLVSSRFVAESLATITGLTVRREVIGRLSLPELRALPGDVIFPVLHGGWGEGGPLQELLEQDGRPYVGSGPGAARIAMDKCATKLAAAGLGIPTAPSAILNTDDDGCPIELPVVVKPVHEGSSVGLHICRTREDWDKALAAVKTDRARFPARVYMIEQAVLGGRELTVGVLDGSALPIIEIRPESGVYDYQAKYHRADTRYTAAPDLPGGVAERLREDAESLAEAIGVRHLARADFILDASGQPWLLEINTMPGFTDHSLLPMAAGHAGFSFAQLTRRLVEMALRDHARAVTV